jgi:hypothetical protein
MDRPQVIRDVLNTEGDEACSKAAKGLDELRSINANNYMISRTVYPTVGHTSAPGVTVCPDVQKPLDLLWRQSNTRLRSLSWQQAAEKKFVRP